MVALLITMLQKTKDMFEDLPENIWQSIKDFLNLGIHIGEGEESIDLTIGLLLLVIISFILTSLALGWFRKLVTRKMEEEDKHKFISIFQFIKYVIYLTVVMLTLSFAGVDITLILTASAAFFVGLGLALQELFQDVIGGIYIILDKSLHVGDIVEVEGKVGRVFEIKLRTTRAITRDDKVIIIPNHKFISDIIYNYTQNYRTTRELVRVGVAYGSDVNLVTDLLLRAVREDDHIMDIPEPFVLFDDFGDSALMFSVHYYTEDSFTDPKIKSRIRYKIDELFRENGVTIPFPQRDVHLYTQQPIKHSSQPSTLPDTNT